MCRVVDGKCGVLLVENKHGYHTFRSLNPNLLKPLRLLHRPHDSLHQLLNLLVQTPHIRILLGRLLIDLHSLNPAIILRRQRVKHQITILIHANQIPWLQLLMIHEPNKWQENSLPSTRLNHRALPNPRRIEIDIRAFLSSFLLHIQIQQLHNITNQVG
jgi:hypothetical protein